MKCPTCKRRVRIGRDELYVRRNGALAHIACPNRPVPVAMDGACDAVSLPRNLRCSLPRHTRGDHYDARTEVSWYRIGGTTSQYAGLPRTTPRNVATSTTPHVKERARVVATAQVAGPPPGEPRALAYLRYSTTVSGTAWYIEAAGTGRIVWAGLKGTDAATWARSNRYRIVRAPDQSETPAVQSSDLPTVVTGGSVPITATI